MSKTTTNQKPINAGGEDTAPAISFSSVSTRQGGGEARATSHEEIFLRLIEDERIIHKKVIGKRFTSNKKFKLLISDSYANICGLCGSYDLLIDKYGNYYITKPMHNHSAESWKAFRGFYYIHAKFSQNPLKYFVSLREAYNKYKEWEDC